MNTPTFRFDEKYLNSDEIVEKVVRRHDALFGKSNFWVIAEGVTATGSPNDLTITRQAENTNAVCRTDTITTFTSIDSGRMMFAGHRALWSSADTGSTWQEISIPIASTTISAYTRTSDFEVIGYRGLSNTINNETTFDAPGGLFIRHEGNDWEKVVAVPGNYIFNISVDNDGKVWVVSTQATLNTIANISESDTVVTQADFAQADIDIHVSDNGGASFRHVQTIVVPATFNSITGVVSQGPNGYVLALSDQLLFMANGSQTFTSMKVIPYGIQLSSARMDKAGNAWIATSDGIYVVNPQAPSSVVPQCMSVSPAITIAPNPIPLGVLGTISCATCLEQDYDVVDIMGRLVSCTIGTHLQTTALAPGVYSVRGSKGGMGTVVVLR